MIDGQHALLQIVYKVIKDATPVINSMIDGQSAVLQKVYMVTMDNTLVSIVRLMVKVL